MLGNKHTMRCPRCRSTNIQVMGNNRKGFSAGKAAGGALLSMAMPGVGTGIGALAGFSGKKGKYDVFCMDCGHRWKTK